MAKSLSRYELGVIRKLHDETHYREASLDYLAYQLARIGLPANVSRFRVAQRIKELEREIEDK